MITNEVDGIVCSVDNVDYTVRRAGLFQHFNKLENFDAKNRNNEN